MIDIKHYAQKAHEAAKAKGWWDEPSSMPTLKALIISELCEALEADRIGRHANVAYFKHRLTEIENSINSPVQNEVLLQHYKTLFKSHIKDSVSDELADAAIRILDVLGWESGNNNKLLVTAKSLFEKYSVSYIDNESIPEAIFYIIGLIYEDRSSILQLVFVFAEIVFLSKQLNIDLIWHIEAKMRYNELRQRKHGKSY